MSLELFNLTNKQSNSSNFQSIDDIVEFDEKEHLYQRNGHIFNTSVTSFVHDHFPIFVEKDVINNILNSKKMTDPSYEYYGMDREAILRYWNLNRDLGTIMHAEIENFYIGVKENRLELPKIITTEFMYFLNFARDYPNINPFKTEFRLYSYELDLAGSIDLLVKNPDETYFIFDWKRAKNIDKSTTLNYYTKYGTLPGISHIVSTNYNHYCFQLNVYRYILQTYYGLNVTGMALAVFHPNNKSKNYEIHSVPFMDDEMSYIMELRKEKVKNMRLTKI